MDVTNNFVLVDYVLLLGLLAEAILGAVRGFSRTAAGTVAVLAAVIGAILCAGTLTPWLTGCLQTAAAESLAGQLMSSLSLDSAGADALTVTVLGALQNTVVRPLLFTLAFLLILVVWLYACCYFQLDSHFPAVTKFGQLGGAVFGLVKGAVLEAAVLYILSRLGILSTQLLSASFLLQKLQTVLPILP
ncbi:MAG: CvpA family protein [Clostridiales bacterium]|nr:CvpA family protein [Clostridiales bacterium]